MANRNSSNVSIFKNNGNGTFQGAVNYPAHWHPRSVFCADLDGDDDLDLAAACWTSNNVAILKNNGNGTFQSAVYYAAGENPKSVFCADLDADADSDLAVANYYGWDVSILKNNGNGTFQSAVHYEVGLYPYSVFCADLDRDDDLDLAVANEYSHNVSILQNDGDGTFQGAVNYGAGDGPLSVFCADLDGDTDLDLSVANAFSDKVSILINLSSANQPPTAFIDDISPNPAEEGQTVSFSGHGEDTDGTIVGYNWRSSIDGFLSDQASFSTSGLSPGTHTIYFKVQDNDSEWSTEVYEELWVYGDYYQADYLWTQGGGVEWQWYWVGPFDTQYDAYWDDDWKNILENKSCFSALNGLNVHYYGTVHSGIDITIPGTDTYEAIIGITDAIPPWLSYMGHLSHFFGVPSYADFELKLKVFDLTVRRTIAEKMIVSERVQGNLLEPDWWPPFIPKDVEGRFFDPNTGKKTEVSCNLEGGHKYRIFLSTWGQAFADCWSFYPPWYPCGGCYDFAIGFLDEDFVRWGSIYINMDGRELINVSPTSNTRRPSSDGTPDLFPQDLTIEQIGDYDSADGTMQVFIKYQICNLGDGSLPAGQEITAQIQFDNGWFSYDRFPLQEDFDPGDTLQDLISWTKLGHISTEDIGSPIQATLIVDPDNEIEELNEDNNEIISYVTPDLGEYSPNMPDEPSGVTSGELEVEYSYASSTTDPNGDTIYYTFDWGDGSYSEWLGPFASGTEVIALHSWSKRGNYKITVKATDEHGAESDRSPPLEVVIAGGDDPPLVELLYPSGGDSLQGAITIEWTAYDSIDGSNLPIYLCWSPKLDVGEAWSLIGEEALENTGEYEWNHLELPDGEYLLMIAAMDSSENFGFDQTEPFFIDNLPPSTPAEPSGPSFGYDHFPYSYSTSTTDPENDSIYYLFDWGDETSSEWLGPFNSEDTCAASHAWAEPDTYYVKVKAKDTWDQETDWSDSLSVVVNVANRGDANGDGEVNVTDIVYLINYLFNETSPPDPYEAGDANCDGKVDVVDIVFLINYLFGEGPPPGC